MISRLDVGSRANPRFDDRNDFFFFSPSFTPLCPESGFFPRKRDLSARGPIGKNCKRCYVIPHYPRARCTTNGRSPLRAAIESGFRDLFDKRDGVRGVCTRRSTAA